MVLQHTHSTLVNKATQEVTLMTPQPRPLRRGMGLKSSIHNTTQEMI